MKKKGSAVAKAAAKSPRGFDLDSVPSASLDLPPNVDGAILGDMRVAFERGDRNALFRAIAHCANQGRPLPEWAVLAYFQAMNRWWMYEVRTLDEAFGVAFPKGRQIGALRRRKLLAGAIYQDVERLRNQGRAINPDLFREVGDAHAIGKTKAEEYYRHFKRLIVESTGSPALALLLEPYMTSDAKLERATRKVAKLSGSRSRKS